MSWATPAPRWDTVAGQVLDSFFAGVQAALPDYRQPLTIFGSAPIQLCLDESFTSADVDIMVLTDSTPLRQIAKALGIGRSGTLRPAYGVQICPPQLFRPTPHYLQRARVEVRHGLTVIIPHLSDILIAKLHRARTPDQEGLVPKDLRAFQRVRELCDGHPTEADMLADLIACEPSFRLPLDGSVNAFRLNAQALFLSVYGRPLDVQREIVTPALAAASVMQADAEPWVAEQLAKLQPTRE